MEVNRRLPGRLRNAGVSRREAEVLEALTERLSNAEIARSLCVSERTVESHVSSLLRKLGVGSRADLAEIGRSLETTLDELPSALSSLLAADAGPFVGRAEELALADRVLADPARNRAAALWVLGEPGVGKTRLAAEIAQRAHAGGALVLFGRCNEDLGVPYQPFLEALQWFVARLPDDEVGRRLGDAPGELTRLVPGLDQRLPGRPPRRFPNPEIDQYRFFEGVRSWLACAGQPVVLVIDDVHWATTPTLQLLGHVAGSVETSRAVLVCTARDTTPDESEAIAALVGELERRGAQSHHLELRGLQADALGELVEGVLERRLDQPLRDLTLALHRETAGNPLFVRALLASLSDDHEWPAGDIPRDVAQTVRRRLRRLPEELSQVLRAAALVGLEFDLRLVARASDHDELVTLEVLELADRAGLVEEAGVNRYRFVHALVRAALREELSESRRVRLHQRTGEAIEALHGDRLDDHLPALAYHYFRACASTPNTATAVAYAVRAGDRALDQLAHDEAVAYYHQALELLDRSENPPADARCHKLMISLGEAQRRAGNPSYRNTLLNAAYLAQEQGDTDALAKAALANHRGLWTGSFRVDTERVAVLEAALEAARGEDSPIRARLLAHLGSELIFAGDWDRCVSTFNQATIMARRLNDDATLADVLARCHGSLWEPTLLQERLAGTAELFAVAERLNDPLSLAWASFSRFVTAMHAGYIDTADRSLQGLERLAVQLGQPIFHWITLLCRADRHLLAGRIDEGERLATEAFEVGQATGQPDAGLVYGTQRFQFRFEQGRLGEIIPRLQDAVARTGIGITTSMLALAFSELDRLDEAERTMEGLLPELQQMSTVPTRLIMLSNCAAACSQVNNQQLARQLDQLLVPFAGQVGGGPSVWTGAITHYLGMLASTMGRFNEAEERFAAAEATHERIGTPTWLARTRLERARMLLARRQLGDAGRAEELLRQALATARKLGLANVQRRAVASLE